MHAPGTNCASVTIDRAAHSGRIASAKVPSCLDWLACLAIICNLSSEFLSALSPLDDGWSLLSHIDMIQAEGILKLSIRDDALESSMSSVRDFLVLCNVDSYGFPVESQRSG